VADATKLMIISSDGHVGALMADYRPYLEERYHSDFDRFLVDWNDRGSRNFDRPALMMRLDPESVDEWSEKMVDTHRIDGFTDPRRRLKELDNEGIAAEVLFPDFGLPFELYSMTLASAVGAKQRDEEYKQAGMRAFNRWVADFVSVASDRFTGMAYISWQQDPEITIAEIRQAHESGLKGIVLPQFDLEKPLYHPDFDRVWSCIEEIGLIVNSHSAMSSTSNRAVYTPGVPHAACTVRLHLPESLFYTHNILSHLIWGGVLERHPLLKVVFTEQGSGWIAPTLQSMDYSYEGSYFRTDYREVIPNKPSEYFARQCFIGSSIFSRAEIAARNSIGLDKMMLGMDFPHHEGTLIEGTAAYLQATLGAEGVVLEEARQLLGGNAAEVFAVDPEVLLPVVARIGISAEDVLIPPSGDLFPRGDVHKPLSMTA
jgi:predicted TIM-barrel fold metal-dependent hydrolase